MTPRDPQAPHFWGALPRGAGWRCWQMPAWSPPCACSSSIPALAEGRDLDTEPRGRDVRSSCTSMRHPEGHGAEFTRREGEEGAAVREAGGAALGGCWHWRGAWFLPAGSFRMQIPPSEASALQQVTTVLSVSSAVLGQAFSQDGRVCPLLSARSARSQQQLCRSRSDI